MHDMIIRGGLIYDGTGAPPFRADIAIAQGCIAEIGDMSGSAAHIIDAQGAIVTPGFIDIHTHFDGQFMWDDILEPSFSHGVTTALAGNCGVGFAPVRDSHRRELIELMEGVEDIPGVVLNEGLDWQWESFGDYLDRLSTRHYTMDIAANITHAPLRVYVMGDRAIRHEDATAQDIEQMAQLVREAMADGALGLSMSRFVEHYSSSGFIAPGTFASRDEMMALAKAMGESGHGTLQIITRGGIGKLMSEGLSQEERRGEHQLLEDLATISGRPLTYGVVQFPSDPSDAPMMARLSAQARRDGLNIRPQAIPRGIGTINVLDGFHAFAMKPSYMAIAHLPVAERARAMRDPDRRRAILSEPSREEGHSSNPLVLAVLRGLEANVAKAFIPTSPLDCEPDPQRRVAVLAQAAGQSPAEYLYDYYAQGDGSSFTYDIELNYTFGDLDVVRDLMFEHGVLPGQGDAGAHVKMIADASYPTAMLAFWARDRRRGEKLPLEFVVHSITGAAAELYGLNDRGVIAEGKRADINVIDFDALALKPVQMVSDLPSGGMRMVQGASGYRTTMVAGVVTRRQDCDTGARPGRLIRQYGAAAAG